MWIFLQTNNQNRPWITLKDIIVRVYDSDLLPYLSLFMWRCQFVACVYVCFSCHLQRLARVSFWGSSQNKLSNSFIESHLRHFLELFMRLRWLVRAHQKGKKKKRAHEVWQTTTPVHHGSSFLFMCLYLLLINLFFLFIHGLSNLNLLSKPTFSSHLLCSSHLFSSCSLDRDIKPRDRFREPRPFLSRLNDLISVFWRFYFCPFFLMDSVREYTFQRYLCRRTVMNILVE